MEDKNWHKKGSAVTEHSENIDKNPKIADKEPEELRSLLSHSGNKQF